MNVRLLLAAALCFPTLPALAQGIGVPPKSLPDTPFVVDTAEQGPVRVSVMKGLSLPWDMAFLPNGDLLVTERPSRQLRVVRNFALVPEPIAGLPEMSGGSGAGTAAALRPGRLPLCWRRRCQ